MSTQAIRDALAAVDTPTAWTCDGHDIWAEGAPFELLVGSAEDANDAAFIAACNPAAIAALVKELDAAKADAERYRWLRAQDWFAGPMCVLRDPKRVLTKGIGIGADCPSGDRLDTAIDKARAALTPSIGEQG